MTYCLLTPRQPIFHLTVESRAEPNRAKLYFRELAHFRAPLGFSPDDNGQYCIAYNYDQRADACSILSAESSFSVRVQFMPALWYSFQEAERFKLRKLFAFCEVPFSR
jgi:hypothetical protein